MNNDYIIELPQLENSFDDNQLWTSCQNNKHNIYEYYGVEYFEIPPTQPEVKHIFNSINSDMMYQQPMGWYMHKFEDKWLKPHIDTDRDAIIMFPIKPKNYTITFLDSLETQNIIYEHRYNCPTIVNSKVPHCVYDQGIDRHFFQISLFIKDFDWNKLRELVINGEFLI